MRVITVALRLREMTASARRRWANRTCLVKAGCSEARMKNSQSRLKGSTEGELGRVRGRTRPPASDVRPGQRRQREAQRGGDDVLAQRGLGLHVLDGAAGVDDRFHQLVDDVRRVACPCAAYR